MVDDGMDELLGWRQGSCEGSDKLLYEVAGSMPNAGMTERLRLWSQGRAVVGKAT